MALGFLDHWAIIWFDHLKYCICGSNGNISKERPPDISYCNSFSLFRKFCFCNDLKKENKEKLIRMIASPEK
jgi:hypothetical protein